MVDEEIINRAKKATIAVVVPNIKQIADEILSSLKAGDIVQKEDSSGKHSYVVSFKKDGTGICLTYTDAFIVETQSYDYTDGHWVYNSEDKTEFANIGHTDEEVKALAKEAVEDASAGTIQDALGLDDQGNLVKGQASGGSGTKLYIHKWTSSGTPSGYDIGFVSTESSPCTIADVRGGKIKGFWLYSFGGGVLASYNHLFVVGLNESSGNIKVVYATTSGTTMTLHETAAINGYSTVAEF